MADTKPRKLSPAQQRVLDASSRGELTYHQSSGGFGSRCEIDGRVVPEPTIHVLMYDRKLLGGPTLEQRMGLPFSMTVWPTEAGWPLVTKEEQ